MLSCRVTCSGCWSMSRSTSPRRRARSAINIPAWSCSIRRYVRSPSATATRGSVATLGRFSSLRLGRSKETCPNWPLAAALRESGAQPIRFRRAEEQASPFVYRQHKGRKLTVSFDGVQQDATLLEELSPHTSAALAVAPDDARQDGGCRPKEQERSAGHGAPEPRGSLVSIPAGQHQEFFGVNRNRHGCHR